MDRYIKSYAPRVRDGQLVGRYTRGTCIRATMSHLFAYLSVRGRDVIRTIMPLKDWVYDHRHQTIDIGNGDPISTQLLEQMLDFPVDLMIVGMIYVPDSGDGPAIDFVCVPLNQYAASAFCHEIAEGQDWPYEDTDRIRAFKVSTIGEDSPNQRWSCEEYYQKNPR